MTPEQQDCLDRLAQVGARIADGRRAEECDAPPLIAEARRLGVPQTYVTQATTLSRKTVNRVESAAGFPPRQRFGRGAGEPPATPA